jgi:hypothetical protein
LAGVYRGEVKELSGRFLMMKAVLFKISVRAVARVFTKIKGEE